jgi:hypothetical protein
VENIPARDRLDPNFHAMIVRFNFIFRETRREFLISLYPPAAGRLVQRSAAGRDQFQELRGRSHFALSFRGVNFHFPAALCQTITDFPPSRSGGSARVMDSPSTWHGRGQSTNSSVFVPPR